MITINEKKPLINKAAKDISFHTTVPYFNKTMTSSDGANLKC